MTLYLLDTNIVSDFIRSPRGTVGRRIIELGDTSVAMSIVVACELRFGAERRRSRRLTMQIEEVLDLISVLPLGDDADLQYGRLRADLLRRGLPIGANDLFIAAHALSLGATLVTDNVREFERVEGLAIENWLRPI